MRYEDFILHIGADQGQGYPVHVRSPAGRGSGVFQLPFDPRELRRHLPTTNVRHLSPQSPEDSTEGSTDAGTPPLAHPREIGDRLFRALFTDRVRQLFDQSWGRVQSGGEGLRIQIRLDPEEASTARLAELPWELLYQAETRQFLNLSRKSPVSRDLVVPRPAQPLVFPTPLRLVAVTVNPRGTDRLQLERERELLQEALEHTPAVHADFPRVTTAAGLRRALRQQRYHALHFMGHGEFDERRGEGIVLFEDHRGGLDGIPGSAFADEIRDCESLRLVVLNACSTGRWTGDGGDPFAGVASALVLSGLPAVLAMQDPISDEAAIAFAQELYQHLADGDPVDAAVVEGRLAIQRQARADGTDSEWATPALFLRTGSEPPTPEETPGAQREEPHGRRSKAAVLAGILLLMALATAGAVGYLEFSGQGILSREAPSESARPANDPSDDSTSEPLPVSGSAPSPGPDIQALQKPPYRSDAFSTYLQPPGTSLVDTSGWLSALERRLENLMSPLHLSLTRSRNAGWLVVLEIQSPRLGAEVVTGRPMQRCDLNARFELYRQRTPVGPTESLSATASGFTPEAACTAGLDKLAGQVGQRLQDAFLSS